MIQTETLEQWIRELGCGLSKEDKDLYRIVPPGKPDFPPFYVQRSDHWIMLSILPVFASDVKLADDVYFRLLTVNRDLRIAKFALDADDQVVLCAELPTESLDYSEFADAVHRMVKYVVHYRDYLGGKS
jgi:hypothetical protein